jgi:hypothetical protein
LLDALFASREHKARQGAVKPGRGPRSDHKTVKELLRTNDAVLLSWAQAVLSDFGIDAIVLDTHTAILEGSIAAIQRRLMVADEDHDAALRQLEAARRDLRHV